MPIYEAKCKQCNTETTYRASISEMYQTPICCGQPMEKVILSGVLGAVDKPHFMTKFKNLYNNRN